MLNQLKKNYKYNSRNISPILSQANYKRIEELRTNQQLFHAQLYLAKNGAPKMFSKSLQQLKTENFIERQKAVESVELLSEMDPKLQRAQVQTVQENSRRVVSHFTNDKTTIEKTRVQLKELVKPRREVIEIIEWVDKQLSQLNIVGKKNLSQIFQERQTVFSAAMGELIRQVSNDCKERGVMIRMVWDSMVDMTNSLVQFLQKQISVFESQGLNDVNRAHKIYQSELDRLHSFIKKQNEELAQQKEENVKIVKDRRFLRKKISKLEWLIRQYAGQVRAVSDDYKLLLKENIHLTMMAHQVDLETAKQTNLFQNYILYLRKMNRQFESKIVKKKDIITIQQLENQVHQEIQQIDFSQQKQKKVMQIIQNQNMENLVLNDNSDDEEFIQQGFIPEPPQDKETDTNDLLQCYDQETFTENLIKFQDQNIQAHMETKTQQTQTVQEKKLMVSQVTQTNQGKPVHKLTQTDFKEPIKSISPPLRQPLNDVSPPMSSSRLKEVASVKKRSERALSQISLDDEHREIDPSAIAQLKAIESNTKNFETTLYGNTQDGKIEVHEVKKFIDTNNQLIDDLVNRVIENNTEIEQKEQEMKQEILQKAVTIHDATKQLNEQKRVINTLQKDLKDLQDMAVEMMSPNRSISPLSMNPTPDIKGFNATQNQKQPILQHSVSLNSPILQILPKNDLSNISKKIIKPPQMKKSITLQKTPSQLQKADRRQSGVMESLKVFANEKTKDKQNLDEKEKEDRKQSQKKRRNTKNFFDDKKNFTVPVTGTPFAHQQKTIKQKSQSTETSALIFMEAIHYASSKIQQPTNKAQIVTNTTKTLQLVFSDLVKQNKRNEAFINPLHVLIYDHFIQKFGLKNVAERNFAHFIRNIYIIRNDNEYLKLFANLIFPPQFTLEEFSNVPSLEVLLGRVGELYQDGNRLQMCINALSFLDESGQRTTIAFDRMFTSLLKIQETASKWISSTVKMQQIDDMISDYEQEEIQLNQQINTFKVVNRVLELADLALGNIEVWIELILLTMNEHGRQPLTLSAFVFFYRCIEKVDCMGLPIIQHFEEEADTIDEIFQENAMSLSRFVYFCSRHKIFTEQRLEEFLGVPSLGQCHQIKLGFFDWSKRIKWNLFSQKRYTNSHKRILDKMDTYLGMYTVMHGEEQFKIVKIVILADKLIQRDSQIYLEDIFINEMLPQSYKDITTIYQKNIIPKTFMAINK